MTEEEKATAPTAEKGPKDCKTCHSAGHIGPVCADCIELAYRHYTPEAPEGDGAEEGEELAALLITLDDAVGDLEADGNPEYAEAIKQARHILTVLTQPKEPQGEASGGLAQGCGACRHNHDASGDACVDCNPPHWPHFKHINYPGIPDTSAAWDLLEKLTSILNTRPDLMGDGVVACLPVDEAISLISKHDTALASRPQAEASREALIDRIADLERALQAERGAYDDLAAFTASLPAPADEKALRAPRGDGSGGWTLDYGYLNLIAETMNQEFRVGMEEIEAVILAHEAPKDGSGKEEGR